MAIKASISSEPERSSVSTHPRRPRFGLVRDRAGQAITEYILLLSLTTAGAVVLARTLLTTINSATLTFGGQLEKDLKTGRAPLDVWRN